MGLDMYLYKVKKFPTTDEITASDIMLVNDYYAWINYNDYHNLNITFKDWCGKDESALNQDLLDYYESEVKTTYYSWDKDHQYPQTSILTMIMDWRKANAIHKWFVDITQDGMDECEPSFVSIEQLQDLLDLIDRVLVYKNVPEKLKATAETLLPTQPGFFFGSYDYDEEYLYDLKTTQEFLQQLLNQSDLEEYDYIYQASW